MENKTSKYFKYAIGEIILVVIGILIALQINNWNENRINKIQETRLLNSFKMDVLVNMTELNRIIEKTELTIKATDSILKYEQGILIDFNLESFSNCMMDAASYTIYMTQEGTIQDIMGSGNLRLITNDSVRLAIGSWNANLKLIREREKLDKISQESYTAFLRDYINFYEIDKKNLPINQDIINELMTNRNFLNHISDRKHYPRMLNKIYKKEIPKLETLLGHIDKELNEK